MTNYQLKTVGAAITKPIFRVRRWTRSGWRRRCASCPFWPRAALSVAAHTLRARSGSCRARAATLPASLRARKHAVSKQRGDERPRSKACARNGMAWRAPMASEPTMSSAAATCGAAGSTCTAMCRSPTLLTWQTSRTADRESEAWVAVACCCSRVLNRVVASKRRSALRSNRSTRQAHQLQVAVS